MSGEFLNLITAILAFIVAALAMGSWEWRKVLSREKSEQAIKNEILSLKQEMQTLHDEHQKILNKRDGEHAEVMRSMTDALNNLNGGIHELTHYIKWLGERETGQRPPPPLPQ